MYDSLRRRGGTRIAGAHARQVPVDAHLGDRWDFLRRHERAARAAALGTRSQRRSFAVGLLSRVADPRNLMCAIDHLTAERDKAPGPSGLRLEHLDAQERWSFARAISAEISSGDRWPTGPVRLVAVSKTSGAGCRPIEIANAEDRIAQRAVAQILQPLLDPQFDERSFGFRPGLDREHAVAEANALVTRFSTGIVIKDDIRNAFGNVPQRRLLDILRRHGLDELMVTLIEQLIANGRGRGIPQGGCLCPLLLNVYLDWLLDRPWRQVHPEALLIRYADDLLILCPPGSDGSAEYATLYRLTQAAGMPLKGNPEEAIVSLNSGQQVEWLGFTVAKGEHGLVAHIGDTSWDTLRSHLSRLHDKPQASLRVTELVEGWIRQLGPAYHQEEVPEVYSRVAAVAEEFAFEEIPGLEEFGGAWRQAYARYCCIRRVALLRTYASSSRGRSAYRDRSSADTGRGRGETGNGSPPPSFVSGPEVTLYADGSCLGNRGVGGWAFILDGPAIGERISDSDSHPRATSNRMELVAVIKGLEALEFPVRLKIVTDSEYVYQGLTERLPRWRENRWRRCGGGRLANVGLWQRLEQLLAPHFVTCQWVPGHGGNPTHDQCDVLARQAAQAATSRRPDTRADSSETRSAAPRQ